MPCSGSSLWRGDGLRRACAGRKALSKVNLKELRERAKRLEQRRTEYLARADAGALVRHETWRLEYLIRPYLLGAPDDRVAERFRHVFVNTTELDAGGRLTPVPLQRTDEYMQVFTHLLEEYANRPGGGIPDGVVASSRAPLLRYFEKGTPAGVRMFESYAAPPTPIIVKYGKRQFLEPMLATGDLRLANAGLYNDASHSDAVRDDETSRTFFIPTWRERLEGRTGMDFQGHRIEFEDDDIVMPLVFGDYYLFSLCEQVHHRMPTDFDADAAIVIRDPARFKQRLISTFLARLPDWEPLEGPVTYYDPYRDYSKFTVPEMAKHFGYGYQREVRVAFRPRVRPKLRSNPCICLSARCPTMRIWFPYRRRLQQVAERRPNRLECSFEAAAWTVVRHPRRSTSSIRDAGSASAIRRSIEALSLRVTWPRLSFYGTSFICDERGDVVSQLGRDEEGVITATIDLDRVRRHRASFGFFRDRRPKLYGRLALDA